MSTGKGERKRRCRYCDAEVRDEVVIVGKAGVREVPLMIDRWPHEDGEVIRRNDGKYRMLAPGRKAVAGFKAFRVHSRRACDARQGEGLTGDGDRGRDAAERDANNAALYRLAGLGEGPSPDR